METTPFPGLVLDNTGSNELEGFFGELGFVIGSECGGERAGDALSDLIVYLSSEAPHRAIATQAMIYSSRIDVGFETGIR